jgi:hypothetical protein
MRKPNDPTIDFDYARPLGRLQVRTPRPAQRRRHQPHLRLGQRGRHKQRLPGRRRQRPSAAGDQGLDVAGHWQRLARRRDPSLEQDPRDLQRKQGIAVGRLRHAHEHRPRQRPAELGLDDLVEGRDVQGTDTNPDDPVVRQRPLQAQPVGVRVTGPAGGQDPHPRGLKPPHGKVQHAGRWRVQPLQVVDRDQERLVRCQLQQGAADRRRQRAWVARRAVGVAAQQRDLQRLPLRRRQAREEIVGKPGQQVGERRQRQLGLALGGAAAQDGVVACRGTLGGGLPQRGLADARAALQHQRRRARRHAVEETLDGCKLAVAAEHRTPLNQQPNTAPQQCRGRCRARQPAPMSRPRPPDRSASKQSRRKQPE